MPESPDDAVLCNDLRTQEPSAELMKRAAARIETLSVQLATREREEAEKPKAPRKKPAPKATKGKTNG